MADFLYVGFAGGVEEQAVPSAGIPLLTLHLATPDTFPKRLRAARDMARGVLICWKRFRKFRIQVLLSTGGFVSIPATLAAWLLGKPAVIYCPDVRPGVSVRYASPLARRIAVSTQDTIALLSQPQKATVTGYPVRAAFLTMDRATARERMDLADGELQLLVTGGSLGAAAINCAVAAGLAGLLDLARVVHVCGSGHIAEMSRVRDQLPVPLRRRYRVFSYLDEQAMAIAMFASDLAITRGGASILGELPAAGLPAVIVPLPAERLGQHLNAGVLERHNACVVVSDHHAAGDLVRVTTALLTDAEMRHTMARAMASLRRPQASAAIAEIVIAEAAR